MVTLREIFLLKIALSQGGLTPLEIKSLLVFQEKSHLKKHIEAQGLTQKWRVWEKKARAQLDQNPALAQVENQRFLGMVQKSNIFSAPKLQKIIVLFRQALSQRPSLRLWEFLIHKKVFQPSHLISHFGAKNIAQLGCPKCNYSLSLQPYLPWRKVPCLFCSDLLSPISPFSENLELEETKPQNTSHPTQDDLSKDSLSNKKTAVLSSRGLTGEMLGKYKILSKLGQGGMGAVYKVYDIELKRTVALKVITSSGGDDSRYIERFYREVRLSASLHHPNIVPVYEFGELEDQPYYTMGYIEGDSLRKYVETRGQLSEREALTIVSKVARAVEYAHSKEVIHRDIKPENIMMDHHGEPHLMDFGLAKKVESSATRLTKTGAIVGSPEFMAPEQAWGEKGVSYGADIYALGGVLFFGLVGHPAFGGDDTMQLLMQVIKESAPKLSKCRAGLSREVEVMVEKCLEKDPQDRYPEASLLRSDMEALIAGEPIWAKPPTMPQKIRRWVIRHKITVAVTVLTLVFLVVLGQMWMAKRGVEAQNKRDRKMRERKALAKQDQIKAEKKQLREIMAKIKQQPPTPFQRISYISTIGKMKGPNFKDLIPYLNSKNKWQREIACEVLGRRGNRRIKYKGKTLAEWMIHRLVKLDTMEELGEAEILIKSLAILKDPRAFDPVLKYRLKVGQHTDFFKNTADDFKQIPLFSNGTPQTFLEWNNLGLRKGLHGQYKEAISCFSRAIKLNPQSLLAHANRGLAKREMGSLQGALKDFQFCLQKGLKEADLLYNIAGLYKKLWKKSKGEDYFNKAVGYYQKAHRLAPKNQQILLDFGQLYIEKGSFIYEKNKSHPGLAFDCYDKAIQILLELKILYPNNLEVKLSLAFAYRMRHKGKKFLECLQTVLRRSRDPKFQARAYMGIGTYHLEQGHYREAIYNLEKAIGLNPQYPEVYTRMSMVYERLKNYKKALQYSQKSLDLEPKKSIYINNTKQFTFRLALEYAKTGQFKKAILLFTKAISIDPNYSSAYFNRGVAYFNLKKGQQALADYTKVIGIKPSFSNAYKARGLLYMQSGRPQQAIADFSSYLKLNPNDPQASAIRAYIRQHTQRNK